MNSQPVVLIEGIATLRSKTQFLAICHKTELEEAKFKSYTALMKGYKAVKGLDLIVMVASQETAVFDLG